MCIRDSRWSGPSEEQRKMAVANWKRMIEIAVNMGVPVINTELSGDPNQQEICNGMWFRSMEELLPIIEREGLRVCLLYTSGRALAMAKKNVKIAVILQSAQTPFMNLVSEGILAAKQEVESLGGSVEVFPVKGVDAQSVMEIMDKLYEEQYSGIALVPSEDSVLKNKIRQFAEEYEIPIVTLNSDVEDTKRLCYVGPVSYTHLFH